ncbi:MAG: glycosyltransferase family 4 protein [Bacteroidetes bacterium]|nr:glycosyltransferase family 4 protein [Bacteroidota bacterium]
MEIHKIAIVSSSFSPHSGGVSSAHYNLYRLLKQQGYDVRVFTNADPDTSHHEDVVKQSSPAAIQRVFRLALSLYFRWHNDRLYHRQLHYIFLAAWASFFLRGPIRRFGPDILIVPDVSAPLYFIGNIPRCKTVLFSHHNPMRFLNNPLIRLHSPLDAENARSIEMKALRHVDRVICASGYMRDVFLETYVPFNPKQVSVIPIPVDEKFIRLIEKKSVTERLGLSEETLCVYIPSAGSDIKGSKYVFEIIRRLHAYAATRKREICFYLSGTIGEELRYELNQLSNTVKIFSPGKTRYEENLAYVKSCSFMISPTLLDSFGMAQLESLLCGLPVVTFDVGGNREMMKNGENGFIIPYLSVEQLISSAEQVCDPVLLETMRKNIQERPLLEFTSMAIIEQLIREMEML